MKNKVTIDLRKLGDAVLAAPPEVKEISELSVKTRNRTMPWHEQLSYRANKSLEDVDAMLEYSTDAEGNPVSKISENTRAKLNLYFIEAHPENVKRTEQTQMVVTIDAATLANAKQAHEEMNRRKAIDATSSVIEQ